MLSLSPDTQGQSQSQQIRIQKNKEKLCETGRMQDYYDCIKPHSFVADSTFHNMSKSVTPLLPILADERYIHQSESAIFPAVSFPRVLIDVLIAHSVLNKTFTLCVVNGICPFIITLCSPVLYIASSPVHTLIQ